MPKNKGSNNSDDTEYIDDPPFLIKMMQNSTTMSLFYELIIKKISSKTSEVEFLKNKNNIKYVSISICLFFIMSLIGMLSYFLFYVMFFVSSLKCILWLFEVYNPDTTNTESDVITQNDMVYTSDVSPQSVLEYVIVPICTVLILNPLTYLPVPGLSFIINSLSVINCVACLIKKTYRQKFCLYIRDTFTNKDKRDYDGSYIPGHEGEFHKLLHTLSHSIDCISMSTYNLTHNPKVMLNQLSMSENITEALSVITSGLDEFVDDYENKTNNARRYNQSNKSKQNKKNKQNKKQKNNNHNNYNNQQTQTNNKSIIVEDNQDTEDIVDVDFF